MPAVPVVAQAPPTHGQVALLGLFGFVGLLLALVGFAQEAFGAVLLVGLFLCCHALIVAASWLPHGVLSARLDAFLDKWVSDIGGGFYGLMALAMFIGLEIDGFWSDLWDFDFSAGAIGTALLPWLLGFSIDSILNGVKAAAWPGFIVSQVGTGGALATVAVAWGLFVAGSKVFPQPRFLTEKRRKRKGTT